MKKRGTVTAIDVGTTKICTIIAMLKEQEGQSNRGWYHPFYRNA
jgi:cell division ATPase FtsA